PGFDNSVANPSGRSAGAIFAGLEAAGYCRPCDEGAPCPVAWAGTGAGGSLTGDAARNAAKSVQAVASEISHADIGYCRPCDEGAPCPVAWAGTGAGGSLTGDAARNAAKSVQAVASEISHA